MLRMPHARLASFSVLLLLISLATAAEAKWHAATAQPQSAASQAEDDRASAELPSLILNVCAGCALLDAETERQLHREYAAAAMASGYRIAPLKPVVLEISETGRLPNGKPYLKGLIANIPFRVGDPHPGHSLASVTALMVLHILTLAP